MFSNACNRILTLILLILFTVNSKDHTAIDKKKKKKL